jgi:hypothetical protein
VDRDDLPDRGAGHFASCVAALKEAAAVVVEALIPDYTEGELAPIIRAAPDVVSHNIETVRSLQGAVRDPRASFDRSLAALRHAKALGAPATKTSLLVGLGEKPAEVLAAMDEIRGAEVDMLVIGQYLRPSSRHIPVAEYVAPERFALYARAAQERGFAFTAASPLARTSYRAFEGWKAACPEAGGNITVEALGKPAGCKLIRVRAEFGGGVIRAIRIRGDFFASPEEAFEQVERELAGAAPEEVAARFDRFIRSAGVEVSGISGAALEILLRGALEERRILL